VLEHAQQMQGLTDQEKFLFITEFDKEKKSATTGQLMALLLGGIGGHHFYMGNTVMGIFYLIFCWTGLPAFAALIELFLMRGRVSKFNEEIATTIAIKLKAMRPNPATSTAM